MAFEAENVITVNAGSSSIKLVVFLRPKMLRLLDLSISGIGSSGAKLRIARLGGSDKINEVQIANFTAAVPVLLEALNKEVSPSSVGVIGHRLVHGGSKYDNPIAIKNIPDTDWELLSRLDPIHTPLARQLVAQFVHYYPTALQIACFDTAFFHDLPKSAKVLPIPKKYYELGVRRYGFHGLAYASVVSAFRERAGEVAANGRVILAHLGSGASVTATLQGKPIDTTMGFTPTSGIIMSTRSGDLDPSIYGFLHHQNKMSSDEFDDMVTFESGLLGVSGITGNMYSLLRRETKSEDAALAVELFVRNVKKAIGSYAALLGGVDSLIFSGGIGEPSALIRSRTCQGFEFLGIHLDEAANQNNEFLISSGSSGVGVHVIVADEARVIAEQAVKVTEG